VIAIVGPTATGKSALAIDLATAIGGEIISADSRCVYREFDIGTAKPSPRDRARIPHHLIDVAGPTEEYGVARFIADAEAAIAAIAGRGQVPIVVGGTGYWVHALFGAPVSLGVSPDAALRQELQAVADTQGLSALMDRLAALDAVAAATVDSSNPRRIIRAIEVVTATGRPYAEARQAIDRRWPRQTFGLTCSRARLYDRIAARYDQMVAMGWVDEVRALLARGYDRALPSMSGLGYAEIAAAVVGEIDLASALERAVARCRRFARSQYQWFRLSDARIAWLDADASPGQLLATMTSEAECTS
jgi:tRNA dimethylallyltransferase